MTEIITGALADTAADTLKLLPFLYITYVLMEYLERHTGEKTVQRLSRVGNLGPLLGSVFGIVPQCGFSAAAASLFSGGIITAGTLIAVFLSTSDEMLPIFISERVSPSEILAILGGKVVIGMITGFIIDFLLRFSRHGRQGAEKHIHDLCEAEHCGCDDEKEGSVFIAALKHTVNVIIFIFLITLALTILTDWLGRDTIASFLGSRPVTGVFLAGLIGLIPNCASSVTIAELYLEGMIGTGQMMAGLLVGAGVGLLVLYRTNRHLKENLQITAVLYACGVIWGLIINCMFP